MMQPDEKQQTPSLTPELRGDTEPGPVRVDASKWRIAVTGASGLIGSALVAALSTDGHQVSRLVRSRRSSEAAGAIFWDPATRLLDARHLEGFDAFVHLAGETIAERWTTAQKRKIRKSRVEGTRLLCEAVALLRRPPRVLVSASAIGIYGDRGDNIVDETSPPGTDFLAETAREWEAMAEPARRAGVRVVNARFGIVLSPRGGALAKMLIPFKLGVGGRVGSGQQWMSWVSLHDAVRAVQFALSTAALAGPVNVVSPKPVTNAEFSMTLARVLRRPSFVVVPGFLVRTLFGEMGDVTLLSSQRVLPRRLQGAGFEFRLPELERALRFELQAGGQAGGL